MTTSNEPPHVEPGHVEPGRDASAPDTRLPDTAVPDAPGREPTVRDGETLLESMGGLSGVIFSALPVIVFVPLNSLWGLTTAVYGAIGVAVAIFLWRLLRRQKVMPAVSGLFGVVVAAFIAYRMGDAKGFFLLGIWSSLIYAVVFALSIVARWPLAGVIWHGVNGSGSTWRRNKHMLLAYDLATAVWALFFGLRFVVQQTLYDHDQTGWLAVTRIAMGWPLTIVAVLITVALVRWADRKPPVARGAARHSA